MFSKDKKLKNRISMLIKNHEKLLKIDDTKKNIPLNA